MDFKSIARREDISQFLFDSGLMGNYLELGVFSGTGLNLWSMFKPQLVIGIDIWDDDKIPEHTDGMSAEMMRSNYEKSIKVMLGNSSVKLLKGYSNSFVHIFPDEFFDFIYIDDDHSYSATYINLTNWWPKVKTNAIIAGHDFTRHNGFGVIDAVEQFKEEKKITQFHITREETPSFLCIKK